MPWIILCSWSGIYTSAQLAEIIVAAGLILKEQSVQPADDSSPTNNDKIPPQMKLFGGAVAMALVLLFSLTRPVPPVPHAAPPPAPTERLRAI